MIVDNRVDCCIMKMKRSILSVSQMSYDVKLSILAVLSSRNLILPFIQLYLWRNS